jgi:site-specific recombinase XerC
MNALVVVKPSLAPGVFTEALELAKDFAKAAKSAATQQAYSSDMTIFVEWCRGRGLTALPTSAEVVSAFLADQAALGRRPSTLGRRLAAIRYFHRAANEASPTSQQSVKAVLAGIRRTVSAAPVRKKAATSDIVIAMAADTTSLRALRNRAVLLLGFAGAFRRSELVALNVDDLEETAEGMLVKLRRSKTDQEGFGRRVAIPRGEIACPVAALRAWLDAAGITEGAIFRRIFNKRAQRVTDRAPGAPECRSDREARCHPPRLRPVDFWRPFPPRRLRDECGEARREPDQGHGRHRPQVARDAQDLQPRC